MRRGFQQDTIGIVLVLVCASIAPAETFHLASGGRVVGELLNPKEIPRKTYQIKTPSGALITLDRTQVKEVQRKRPAVIEYEAIRPRYADTIADQWELAQWCRERLLLEQRKRHLERIIQLDPDHAEARRVLGYIRHGEEWKTRDQIRREQGYVKRGSRWLLPQQVQLMKEQKELKDRQIEWKQKIHRWSEWLGGNRSRIAYENFSKVTDPSAIPALVTALQTDPRHEARILYVEVLARIGTPEAREALAVRALADPEPETRLTCLDYLKPAEDTLVVEFFIDRLRDPENIVVNRSAVALRHLERPEAVGPLIDALVTVHKFKVAGKDPGQMTTTFGSGGGGGLSMGGGGTKVFTETVSNRAVLDALLHLTEGASYGFDVPRWKAWFAAQKRSETFNARRD